MASFNLVQLVFDRSALSPDEDVAVCTCHIRQVVSAAPDLLPVTDQGRDDFQANVGVWWAAIRQYVTTKVVLKELRFYDVPAQPGQLMGDPVRVTPFNNPGTNSGQPLPPQLACSVTFKTAHRKRWGRFYIPGITAEQLDAAGRWETALADELAAATQTLTSRAGTGAALTVFSRLHWSHEDPVTIQVDDIADVIRRRRFSSTHYRATVSAG